MKQLLSKIAELKQRLKYAENFTPHKVGYYADQLQEAEDELFRLGKIAEIEAKYKRKQEAEDKLTDFQR